MAFLPVNIFAQIISKEIPAEIVYEDDQYLAFKDINPKAKHHYLVIPKHEYVSVLEVEKNNVAEFGGLFLVAKIVAEKLDLEGYKLHMNVGEEGGQIVPHVHLHLLSSDYQSEL